MIPTLYIFSIGLFFNEVVDGSLVAKYAAKTSYIIPGKSCVHFAIFTKTTAHQVIFGFDTQHLETIRLQQHKYFTGYVSLALFKISFDISHNRIEYLSFMQPVTIELCQL